MNCIPGDEITFQLTNQLCVSKGYLNKKSLLSHTAMLMQNMRGSRMFLAGGWGGGSRSKILTVFVIFSSQKRGVSTSSYPKKAYTHAVYEAVHHWSASETPLNGVLQAYR